MLTASLIILVVMIALAVMTLGAFCWAASNKQFENLEEASHVIFDEDEPIGQPTDTRLPNSQHTHS
ncbi:cbb3-type cytochrome oxidase assembly protein CcoS [Roseibacillus persicicus]|uniref:cbb3-type cytochrome oxidase assembly protein CcoS n=1 Tax=Roseibacillus persicicus TaxID=454148 RepID=UPI00280D8D54|nr:cbb3-type cytochrome oxidase assembly protein CcoS [Roseibacillus persicicus]MDQ8190322.1 cbb3-type cytochrome oxidase assembly protein CcoS [Roseibacillus persicicus]